MHLLRRLLLGIRAGRSGDPADGASAGRERPEVRSS
jgi:hypothetical protein